MPLTSRGSEEGRQANSRLDAQADDDTATDAGSMSIVAAERAVQSDAHSPPSPHMPQQGDAQDEQSGINTHSLSSVRARDMSNTSDLGVHRHSESPTNSPTASGSQRLREAWFRHASINWGGDLARQVSWLNTEQQQARANADRELEGAGTVAAWMLLSNRDTMIDAHERLRQGAAGSLMLQGDPALLFSLLYLK
jgi:hypothetical protein